MIKRTETLYDHKALGCYTIDYRTAITNCKQIHQYIEEQKGEPKIQQYSYLLNHYIRCDTFDLIHAVSSIYHRRIRLIKPETMFLNSSCIRLTNIAFEIKLNIGLCKSIKLIGGSLTNAINSKDVKGKLKLIQPFEGERWSDSQNGITLRCNFKLDEIPFNNNWLLYKDVKDPNKKEEYGFCFQSMVTSDTYKAFNDFTEQMGTLEITYEIKYKSEDNKYNLFNNYHNTLIKP